MASEIYKFKSYSYPLKNLFNAVYFCVIDLFLNIFTSLHNIILQLQYEAKRFMTHGHEIFDV